MNNVLTIGLVAALTLIACAPATDTKTTTPAVTATAELPTPGALAGTWKRTMSMRGGERIVTFSYTFTPSTFTYQTVDIDTGAVPTFSSYSEFKGTYSVSGDQCTLTTTDYRYSPTSFVDASTGWISQTPLAVDTGTRFISGGKLYGFGSGILSSLFKAEGTVKGLLGTWSSTSYKSTAYGSKPYKRRTLTFSEGNYVSKDFESTTATFDTTPYTTHTYTVATPLSYRIIGDYLLTTDFPNDPDSADFEAYIKQ